MTIKRYQVGAVDPWWNLDHRSLPYIHEPFNNPRDVDLWRKLGFTQQRFTGDMYDMRFSEPHWIPRFRDAFPMRHFSWSMYRMRPGDVMPLHSDTYQRFCEIYSIADYNEIQRVVVFVEPWQSGHYFEIDDAIITGWQAGTWVKWQGDTPHLAANLGSTMRYTLQLTGVALN